MATSLCIACAELLPDVNFAEAECPRCGVVTRLRGEPLTRIDGRQRVNTDEEIQKWERSRIRDLIITIQDEIPFQLLGLDESWTGSRWIQSGGGSEVKSVGLHHGDSDSSPSVLVTTASYVKHDSFRFISNLQILLEEVWVDEHEGLEHVQAAYRSQDPFEGWGSGQLLVNDQVRSFHHVQMGTQNVLISTTEDLQLTIVVRGMALDNVKLVDVDVRSYNDIPR